MKKREHIEWCDIWVEHAESDALPRALLIGDSIARSYYPRVQTLLEGRYACARLATSKCVGDPALLKELRLALDEYRYDVVHFNNGLHGYDYTEKTYGAHFPKVMRFIMDRAPGCKLIWATTTPERARNDLTQFDPNTERIRERNRIAREFALAHNIPINDLFELVKDHSDFFGEDGVHFNDAGKTALGDQVAHVILRETQKDATP